jgi:hypothetical protein
MITPQKIETRLYELSKEIDESHEDLVTAEADYYQTKAKYEIAVARSRMTYSTKSAPTGKNYTVQQVEALALLENEELHMNVAISEAKVKSARANAMRIKTQVEITRSIGTSVRTSMELV